MQMPPSIFHSKVARFARALRSSNQLAKWEQSGRPVPPPFQFKVNELRRYAEQRGLKTMIETGTYRGDMDYALRSVFSRIVTIELSSELHAAAKRRFEKFAHIECLQGDSSQLLPKLLAEIDTPCLFWLDAHYSAGKTARGASDTPISIELDAVLKHRVKNHIVLIDDARCFDGTHGYPLLSDLERSVVELRPDLRSSVEDDIIRIVSN